MAGELSGPADPDAARRAAQRILGRPEFQQAPVSPIDRLRHWVASLIGRAIAAGLSGRATILGVILLILIVVTLGVLLRRFTRTVQREPRAGRLVVGVAGMGPGQWLAEASDCERRGDWRGALRARYRALVAELAARHLIDEVPGRTTGEYRAAVLAALPPGAEAFSGATDLFEAAFYGDRPSGRPESEAIAEMAHRVLAAAR